MFYYNSQLFFLTLTPKSENESQHLPFPSPQKHFNQSKYILDFI